MPEDSTLQPPASGQKQLEIVPIRRVGFFHFATDFKGRPVESLEGALERFVKEEGRSDTLKRLRESLLVIPEAFNLRFGYWDRESRTVDDAIQEELVGVSRRSGMAMVVSLLASLGGQKPRNCAYLIDAAEPRILSCKHNYDQSDNYATCNPASSCSDNVIAHRGLQIAALVCMDADQYPGQEKRRKDLLQRLDGPGRKALCVPSCFSRSPLDVVMRWPASISVVLANRATGNQSPQHPSIVRLEEGSAVESQERQTDHIRFWDLPLEAQ